MKDSEKGKLGGKHNNQWNTPLVVGSFFLPFFSPSSFQTQYGADMPSVSTQKLSTLCSTFHKSNKNNS